MLRYHSRDQNTYITNDHLPPISRTVRYKKFTKPLLERKRRARMNRCLDELKLLVGTLEAEGENINKLEKADILELTVRYIKRISRLQDPVQEAHRFQAGFSQCATEACKFLLSLPGSNSSVGNRLVQHLRQCLAKPRSPYPTLEAEHRRAEEILQNRQSASPTGSLDSAKYYDSDVTYKTSKLSHEFSAFLSTRRVNGDDDAIAMIDREESGSSMWRPW